MKKEITFKDIAGYAEEKRELQEICNLILNRDKLIPAGGNMPKGLLLVGPSGVGKTLFAKALINGSKCPCVEINYNDISTKEEFTDYVKSQFESAIKQVPCILYIDQVDRLLGQSSPFGMGDEFDKGIIILNELNRYSDVDGLFILLVSGKSRRIDTSMVRSGRVDRVININLPGDKEREEIVNFYCKNRQFDKDISTKKIANMFRGFTGADIKSVLNNAVIKAFSRNSETISEKDVNDAYYDMLFKTSIKDVDIEEEKLDELAYHEAGHAVLGLLSDPDSVVYASIKPRGNFMGFVSHDVKECTGSTFNEKRNEICTLLAGRVAEQIFLNIKSDGCVSDLAMAKSVVNKAVRGYGMLGLEYLDVSDNPYVDVPSPVGEKMTRIQKVEDELMDDMFSLTAQLLHQNKKLFDEIVDALKTNKNLCKSDIDKIVDEYHLREINPDTYRIVKQRIGMFSKINQLKLQESFGLGYYQANLILKKLMKDKMVSETKFNGEGYQVLVD